MLIDSSRPNREPTPSTSKAGGSEALNVRDAISIVLAIIFLFFVSGGSGYIFKLDNYLLWADTGAPLVVGYHPWSINIQFTDPCETSKEIGHNTSSPVVRECKRLFKTMILDELEDINDITIPNRELYSNLTAEPAANIG